MVYSKAAKVITDYVRENDVQFKNNMEISKRYKEFQEKYGPKSLAKLEDDEILNSIFLHDNDKDNLCYALEFDKDYKFAGSIWGGSSYKYHLFKNKEGNWIYGSSYANKKILTLEEAKTNGKSIINALIESYNLIKKTNLNTPEDYKNLEVELNSILNEVDLKPTLTWVHKYFHMMFPDKFLDIHSSDWKKFVLNKLNIDLHESEYYNEGQIISVIKKTGLSVTNFYDAFTEKFGTPLTKEKNSKHERQIWLLSPGENSKLWNVFKEKNIISIGWGKIGNLNKYPKSKAKKLFEEKYPNSGMVSFNSIYDFYNNMEIGDIVLIKNSKSSLIGVGEVTSDYYFSENIIEPINKNDDYFNLRNVKWFKEGNWEVPKPLLPNKTLTNITETRGEELLELIGGFNLENYGKEQFFEEVLFLEKDYDNIVNLLKRKKNLILQGAPGVGKTHIAKRLAYSIMGEKNEDRIEFVQFHQSYSYEDFIQGYKPTEDGFNLQNGVFYDFCKKASKDLDNDYYFIIDEINRGNISKIFGELMMLIEEDKRGEDFAINLTYGNNKFYVPENVYIIGMMNTADRSLAMIDYALRRRFVFYTINPLFDEDELNGDILKNHLIEKGVEKSLASNIIEKIAKLNDKILNDEDLGYGFRIGHSYFLGKGNYDEQWYKSIIEYEIAPILKEYWFDDLDKANNEIDKLNNISE